MLLLTECVQMTHALFQGGAYVAVAPTGREEPGNYQAFVVRDGTAARDEDPDWLLGVGVKMEEALSILHEQLRAECGKARERLAPFTAGRS